MKRVLGKDGSGDWFDCDLMNYWIERLMHRSETETEGKVVFFSTYLITQLREARENNDKFMMVCEYCPPNVMWLFPNAEGV